MRKIKLVLVFSIGLCTVAACSQNTKVLPTQIITSTQVLFVASSATSTPNKPIETPTITRLSQSESQDTNTPTPVPTPLKFKTIHVEPDGLVIPTPDFCFGYDIPYFSWSGNSQELIYAYSLVESCGNGRNHKLNWVKFDLKDGSYIRGNPLFVFDLASFTSMGLHEIDPFAQIKGLISPNGASAIYTIKYGSFDDPKARVDVWILNKNTGIKKKILSLGYHGEISKAAWIEYENKVIFDIGYEGGSDLYLANTENGTISSIRDLTGYSEGVQDNGWILSPDGNNLAIQGLSSLWILNVKDGKSFRIGESGSFMQWSDDGMGFYYWLEHPSGNTVDGTDIKYYDMVANHTEIFLSKRVLLDNFSSNPYGPFAVSPDKKNISFYSSGDLWVLLLSN